ncbi:hypothetical protein [Nocardia sp. NBC_01327]|uniref:hypothetical protein n=1 Tax=Nocardia sp. NBC_01327 TaxID=2903593 RepID=UPI002E165E63|nr:hypothetical protein OG326_02575 [Nocardia sp. NBC_01327]
MKPEQATTLQFLGKGGTTGDGCPSVYVTDHGTFLIQGWVTDQAETVEIPHLLLGFVGNDRFIGARMEDTGRGTFLLTGRPVTDAGTLTQLDLYEDETAIEVPVCERSFYGVAAAG